MDSRRIAIEVARSAAPSRRALAGRAARGSPSTQGLRALRAAMPMSGSTRLASPIGDDADNIFMKGDGAGASGCVVCSTDLHEVLDCHEAGRHGLSGEQGLRRERRVHCPVR
jgi:hypothetical protein